MLGMELKGQGAAGEGEGQSRRQFCVGGAAMRAPVMLVF